MNHNQFKFGFSSDDTESPRNDSALKEIVTCKECKEFISNTEDSTVNEILNKVKINNVSYGDFEIRCVNSRNVMEVLRNCANLDGLSALKAEDNDSDLIPNEYEGGMKIWECTYDLLDFLDSSAVDFKNKNVLDLGCGAGLLGIYAMHLGADVHFQDYNEDVIKYITVPNVKLNNQENNKTCKLYSGDWMTFEKHMRGTLTGDKKFDYILTSETIYNTQSFTALQLVFSSLLKECGVVFLAAKMCYFGVGGSIPFFEDFLDKSRTFKYTRCWECNKGVKRAILKIEFK